MRICSPSALHSPPQLSIVCRLCFSTWHLKTSVQGIQSRKYKVMKQDKELKVSPFMTKLSAHVCLQKPWCSQRKMIVSSVATLPSRAGDLPNISCGTLRTLMKSRSMLPCYASSPGKHDEAWYTIGVLPNKMILTYWCYLLSKLQKEEHAFAFIKIIPVTPLSLHVNALKWSSPFCCRHLLAIQTHSENTGANATATTKINGSSTDTRVKQVLMHQPYHTLPLGIKAYTEHKKLSLASFTVSFFGASILQTSKVEHGAALATIGYFCASTIGASCDRLCGTSGSNSREELWRGPGSPEGSWWRHHAVSMSLKISCILLNHSPILLTQSHVSGFKYMLKN